MAGNFIIVPPVDLSSLPDAPVSSDVDLRSFDDMPIDTRAVRDSELAAGEDDAAKWTAFMLWCAAWHQVPAGSLPNDEVQIARLAGFGKDLRGWRRRASVALHGYFLASDGRLHHVMAAKKASKAWKSKNAQKQKSDKRWKDHKPLNVKKSRNTVAEPTAHATANATAHTAGYAAAIPLNRGDLSPPLNPPHTVALGGSPTPGPEGPLVDRPAMDAEDRPFSPERQPSIVRDVLAHSEPPAHVRAKIAKAEAAKLGTVVDLLDAPGLRKTAETAK